MKERLKISKPKTRPIQIEPWLFRYLNESQLKLVGAILTFADSSDRRNNSFPANRTLAFYCGFGMIKENTKTSEKYQNLSDDEKKQFLKKRVANAIQTVKNTKSSLEDIGLLRREISGKPGKQIVYLTLDLEWKKEQFLSEFNEYFNDEEQKTESHELNDLLNQTLDLSKKGASDLELLNRLKGITELIEEKNKSIIPSVDIELLATHIMNSEKIQKKIADRTITSTSSYKKAIIKKIKNNSYEGLNKAYMKLQDEEMAKVNEYIFDCLKHDNPTVERDNTKYKINKLHLKDNVFFARYRNSDNEVDYMISFKTLNSYLESFHNKTSKLTSFINLYEENIKKLQRVTNG